MTKTTNDNLNERLTALVDSYGDDANWRPSNDGNCVSFTFSGHRVEVFYDEPELPWDDYKPYWGWAITPGDGRRELEHDVPLATADAKAAAWPAIVRIVKSEGTPEADAERAKVKAERERLVAIECYEAMQELEPAQRTRVVDALRDWFAKDEQRDMTTQPPRPIDATPRPADD